MPRRRDIDPSVFEDLRMAKRELSARCFRSGHPLFEALEMHQRIADLQGRATELLHAVGIGRKRVGGKLTDMLSVRLYVARKLPRRLVGLAAMLPSRIAGIETDVIEAPPAYFAMPLAPCTMKRLTRQRPVQPGASLGNVNVIGGTLGARVRSRKAGEHGLRLMLSNNHVLADFGVAPIGSEICQPAIGDGGEPGDVVGRLLRFAPIAMGAQADNRVDAAVASVDGSVALSSSICTVGVVNGVALPSVDMAVHKHARTTGYSSGVIDDVDCDVLVPLSRTDPTRVARFTHQLRIRPRTGSSRFAQGGDSGALIVGKSSNAAVGLLFACPDNGSYAYANPITDVLDTLEVELD